ncbi:MAG: hypothetical protein LYZ69_08800 [Nitrososphaerales archaeon]|nr:hypothetical protein [Nitrososphaerales archaeon]
MQRTGFVAFSAIIVIVMAGVVAATFTVGARNEVSGATTNPGIAAETVTMTRTLPNGSVVTSTSTTVLTAESCEAPCTQGAPLEGMPGVALEGIAITQAYANATTRLVVFEVKNVGAVNVTLANANVTGDSSNVGFKGSVFVNLQGIRLGREGETNLTTSVIQDLVAGDRVSIIVRTTVGTFATNTVTAGL